MNDILPLEGLVLPVKEAPSVPAITLYLVAAYGFGGWKLGPGEGKGSAWLTQEAAEKRARELGPHWTHRRIVKIELPGQGGPKDAKTQT